MLDFITHVMFKPNTVQLTVMVLSIAIAVGLALGTFKIKGISLGIGGVLFAGLAVGWALTKYLYTDPKVEPLDHGVMDFAKEFGLILFVYTIGMQVGPGFFASLRKSGTILNIFAASIVLMGCVITYGIHKIGGVETPVAVGLFSGATTNTPSLAASTEVLKSNYAQKDAQGNALPADVIAKNKAEALANSTRPALGYGVAYPFGILGIIITMLLMKGIFKIDVNKEAELFAGHHEANRPKLDAVNIVVQNSAIVGKAIEQVPVLADSGIVVSRISQNGKTTVAHGDTRLNAGDVILCVGSKQKLAEVVHAVGSVSEMDLRDVDSDITTRRVIVTKHGVLGKTVDELDLGRRFGANVTRLHRQEIELSPYDNKLSFGDNVLVVGPEASIANVAKEMGDSLKKLNHPQVIPIFVGIALGVILGRIPIPLGWLGVSQPVTLGLAGGPLLAAIILSRIGKVGPLVWHMSMSANFMLREIGIVLFLGCVGILSGHKFVDVLTNGDGVKWMGMATLITFVPIMLVALIARIFFKTNFLTIAGTVSGSMTDPPALAFATTLHPSDACSVAYATVYPLTMLLRVLTAQLMVLLFT